MQQPPYPKHATFDGLSEVRGMGAGDAYYKPRFISDAEKAMATLTETVNWRQVMYRGKPLHRMKEAFADVAPDGSYAYYRYPGVFTGVSTKGGRVDALVLNRCVQVSPWPEVVHAWREQCQALDPAHPLNHGIGTYYHNGDAGIGGHSDKTRDIAPDSLISDISLGAVRTFVLTSANGRRRQEIALQPGSVIVLGPRTNATWTHAVPEEPAVTEPRISVVFRSIVTRYRPQTDEIVEADGSVHPRDAKKAAAIKRQQKAAAATTKKVRRV